MKSVNELRIPGDQEIRAQDAWEIRISWEQSKAEALIK